MEEGFGFPFPDDVRVYFSLCQGQSSNAPCGLLDGWFLLSFDELLDEWRVMGNALQDYGDRLDELVFEGPVRRVFATRGWIPFATDFDGNLMCFDLEPGPGGEVGQVLLVGLGTDERRVLSPGARSFFQHFAERLEAGGIELDDAETVRLEVLLPCPIPGQSCDHPELARLNLRVVGVEAGEDAHYPEGHSVAVALLNLDEKRVQLEGWEATRLEDEEGRELSSSLTSLHRAISGRLEKVLVLESDNPLPPSRRLRLAFLERVRPWAD